MDYKATLLVGVYDLNARTVKPLSRNRFIYFSIKNCKSENHRTFRIKKQPNESKFAPSKLVLELLTGADNEENYTGFAFVNVETGIYTWNKYLRTKNDDLGILVGQLLFGFDGKYSSEVINSYSITPMETVLDAVNI